MIKGLQLAAKLALKLMPTLDTSRDPKLELLSLRNRYCILLGKRTIIVTA